MSLARLTGDPKWEQRAQALIRKYQYLPKDVTVWQKLLKPFHRRLRGVSREQDARPV